MLGPFIVLNENVMHKKRRGRGNTFTVTGCRRALEVAKNVEKMDGRWRDHKMGRMRSCPDRPERRVNAPPSVEWTPTGAKVARSSAGAPRTPGLPSQPVPPPSKSADVPAPPGGRQNPGNRRLPPRWSPCAWIGDPNLHACQ